MRWTRSVLLTGLGLFRVEIGDERRSLAEVYFGDGQGPAYANMVVNNEVNRLQKAEDDAYRNWSLLDGKVISQLEIMKQLYWLRWDDGQSTNYLGDFKGRLARLNEDIIPYWSDELAKALPYPEWMAFTRMAVTNNQLWVTIENM